MSGMPDHEFTPSAVGYYLFAEEWAGGLPVHVITPSGDLEGRPGDGDLPRDMPSSLLSDMTAWNDHFLDAHVADEGCATEADLERHLAEGRALAGAFTAATESMAPVRARFWALRVRGSSAERPDEEFGFRTPD